MTCLRRLVLFALLSLPLLLLVPFLHVICLAGRLAAQNYEVSVTTVQVWIRATYDGKPIAGLKAGDFEVYEDGVKMQQTCFEEVRAAVDSPLPDERSAQTRPVEPDRPQFSAHQQQKYVLFLDFLSIRQFEYLRVRRAILHFADQMHRNGQVMVAALFPTGKLGIVAHFTQNMNRIREVLDEAKGMGKRQEGNEIGLSDGANGPSALSQGGANMSDFRTLGYFNNTLDHLICSQQRYSTELEMQALETVAQHASGSIQGDNVVILWISGGLTECDTFELLSDVKDSIARLKRNNVTIYTINTRGLVDTTCTADHDRCTATSFWDLSADTLWQFAYETNGLAFENSNNFDRGFDNVLSDLSERYIICYNQPEHRKHGKYHRIKVVAMAPNIHIRSRRGYVD